MPRGSTAQEEIPLTPLPRQTTQITGRVLDPNGNPLGGVSITGTGTRYQTTTKPDGNFALSDMPPGNYRLSFSQEALRFETRYEDVSKVSEGENRKLGDITLQFGPNRPPMGALSVWAFGEDGTSITEATLYVDDASHTQKLPATVENLLVNIHEVRVEPVKGYYPDTQQVACVKE